MDNTQLSTPLLSDIKTLERSASIMTTTKELKYSQTRSDSVYAGDNTASPDLMKEAIKKVTEVFNSHLPSEVTINYSISYLVSLSDGIHFLACTYEGVALYIDIENKKFEENKICDKLYYAIVLEGEQKAILSSATALYEVCLPSLFTAKDKKQEFGGRIGKISLSPDQNYLYVVVPFYAVLKVNIEDLKKINILYEGKYSGMAVSQNGELAAFLMNDRKLILQNFLTSKQEEIKTGCDEIFWDMHFSNSQSKILISFEKTIVIINVNPLEVYRVFNIPVGSRSAAITNDDNILIAGDDEGKLKFWDIKNKEQLSEFQIHNKEVILVKLSTDGQLIYTTSYDYKFCTLNFPQFIKEPSIRVKNVNFTPFGTKIVFRSDDGQLKRWDTSTNKTEDIVIDGLEVEGYDSIDEENILIISPKKIIKYDIRTKKYLAIPLKDENKDEIYEWKISDDFAYLATGGRSQKVFLWDLKTMQKVNEFKGSDKSINIIIFLPNSNVIAAGNSAGNAYFWNISTTKQLSNIKTEKAIEVVSMNSFRNEENVIIGYKDNSILVFNWESETLLAKLDAGGVIKSIYVVKDEKMIVATEEGKIFFWDLLTFTLLFYNDLKQKILRFMLIDDEKYFAIKVVTPEIIKEESKEGKKDKAELTVKREPDNLFIKKNPLSSEVVIGAGLGSEFNYMKYIINLINGKGSEHSPEYDKWVIMPYKINTLHLYSYFNRPQQLKLAIDAGGSLFNTTFGESALSLAVKKEYSGCVSNIVSSLGKILKANPNALNFISDKCINGLNMLGYPSLTKFYNLIYTPYTENFVKFVNESTLTPIYYKSKEIFPLEKNFLQENQSDKEGKPVKCMVTSLPLPLNCGSKTSTKFLDSLEKCPNSEIFSTKLIQDILDHKWDELKWAMYWQAIVYTIYMILLSVYILYWIGQSLPLIIIFIFSLLLTSYEVIQYIASPREYIEDIWNYVDATRTILTLIYASTVWLAEKHTDLSYDILVGLVIVSWTRGISYFRIFKNTRYMVNLITQVIKDITSFLILLFYSTLAFAFIFLVMDKNDPILIDYIKLSYRLDLGDFDSSGFTSTQWICLFLATMINMVIMLNLLISIMGDTFGRVQERAEIADKKELLGMITEIETLMFWKKEITERSYFQALIGEESEEAEHTVYTRLAHLKRNQKIYHLKSQETIENVDKRFDNVNKQFENQDKKFEAQGKNFENLEKLFGNQEKKLENLEKRFKIQEKRFENEGKRFENLEEMVKKIWNKLNGDTNEEDKNSAAETMKPFSCDSGHLLKWANDVPFYYKKVEGTWNIVCNICSKVFSNCCWHCRDCKYNVCEDCGLSKGFTPPKLLCLDSEELIWKFDVIKNSNTASYSCSECSETYEDSHWHCKTCRFDLCKKCGTKHGYKCPEFTLTCSKNHPMSIENNIVEIYNTKYGGNPRCDECGANIDYGCQHCNECNYDLCNSCADYYNGPIGPHPGFLCTENHILHYTDSSAYYESIGKPKSFMCKGCKLTKDGGSFHCRKCCFDLCNDCSDSLALLLSSPYTKKCKNEHLLLWNNKTYRGGSYGCDVCGESYKKMGSFHCVECQYDVCIRDMTK